MDISFRSKKLRIPNKKTMNLYQPDLHNDPARLAIFGVLALLVVVGLLSKVYIVDTIQSVRETKAEISQLEMTLAEMQAKYAGYADLKNEYYRYSESYSKDEKQLVDRIEILGLLDDLKKSGYGTITSTSISGNSVNIRVVTASLDQLAKFRLKLAECDFVTDVVVYSASRSSGDVVSSVSFECMVTGEE